MYRILIKKIGYKAEDRISKDKTILALNNKLYNISIRRTLLKERHISFSPRHLKR